MGVVVIAPHRRVFKRTVHPLHLAVRFGLVLAMLHAVFTTDALEHMYSIGVLLDQRAVTACRRTAHHYRQAFRKPAAVLTVADDCDEKIELALPGANSQ